MAINFDTLPDDKGNSLIAKGTYKLKVETAEMKKGKDTSKPEYLNLRYSVFSYDGSSLGSIFDIITESDAQLARYKLKRFIQALNLNLPSFELHDLPKVVTGKELIGDITIETPEGYSAKSVIDSLSYEIFYPVNNPPKHYKETEGAADAPAAAASSEY